MPKMSAYSRQPMTPILVALLAVILSVASPRPALAAEPPQLSGIACPSITLCVAADNEGDVMTTTEPTGGASAWTPSKVDGPTSDRSAVSCPSTALCVVAHGDDILVSTDPTGGASAWTVTTVDVNGLSGVSCPTATLCVAVDRSGNVLTSTDPTGGAGVWTTTNVGSQLFLGVSCPTTTLCVAVDFAGDIITSDNPTGGVSEWTTTPVDNNGYLSGVACPTATLCLAVDFSGSVLTSTNPTGGASAWSSSPIASGFETSLSCPSTTLCVGMDTKGGAVTSANPTGGASAWTTTPEVDEQGFVFGISCPTTSLCVAVDSAGNAITSTDPTGGASAWKITPVFGNSGEPLPENTELPLIAGTAAQGEVLSETHGTWLNNPMSFAYQWERCDAFGNNCQAITGATAQTYTLTAADVGSTIRVQEIASNSDGAGTPAVSASTPVVQAVPSKGEAHNGGSQSEGGSSGPTTGPCCDGVVSISGAQIVTSLAHQLMPSGKAAKIGALLKSGGVTMPFTALEAGTLSVQWYLVPAGAKLAKHTKAKPVLVASGKLTFPAAETGKLKIKLTAAGEILLRRAKRLKLVERGMFTPKGGLAVSTTQRLVLGW
jgi:hypothetical protein